MLCPGTWAKNRNRKCHCYLFFPVKYDDDDKSAK